MKLSNSKAQAVGFSLYECVIVCALISFFMLITISQTTCMHNVLVLAQVRALHAAIQMAQQQAISTNSIQKIVIDLDNHKYYVGTVEYALPSYVRFGTVSGALGPPSHPTQSIIRACTFQNNIITCWPDGIIQSGVLYMVDYKKRYGYALSNAIGAVSYMRMYRYEQSKWRILT